MIDVDFEAMNGTSWKLKAQHLEFIHANIEDKSGQLIAAHCVFVDGENLGSVDRFKKFSVSGRRATDEEILDIVQREPTQRFEAVEDALNQEAPDGNIRHHHAEAPDRSSHSGRGVRDNKKH